MTNGEPSPMTGGRRTRFTLATVTAVLAITSGAVAALRSAPESPETAAVATEAPDATTVPDHAGRGDTLTSGPLLATSPPVRVTIPALHVSVPVVGLGQRPDGSMEVPADATTVGWYTKAPTPGSLGPAVLAGHVDYHKQPGTFAHLATLASGDTVTVARQDGSTATFGVTAIQRYAKSRFPSAAVYGAINHAGLRLITCGGDFDSSTGHYRDNIVVYATLRWPRTYGGSTHPSGVARRTTPDGR